MFPDFNNGGIQRSIELAKQLQVVCTGRKIAGFIKADDINGCTCNPKDGIHLTEEITQLLYPQWHSNTFEIKPTTETER